MDWSRTKSIFIIVFILLDAIIFYQIHIKITEYSYNLPWIKDSMSELEEELDRNIIELETILPIEVPDMSIIKINNNIIANHDTLVEEENIDISFEEIEAILDNKVNNFFEYSYNIEDSNTYNLLYYQKYKGFTLYDARVIVNYDDNGTIKYSQNYFTVLSKGQKKEIISSINALRIAIEQGYIPYNTMINRVELGYKGQNYEFESQDLIPVWKIVCKTTTGNNILYVNALTGGIETGL